MELQIISKGFIKPSSPTPHHLRHLHFSFLDQLQPNIFVPLIHFYPKNSTINNSQRCNQLKKSLSKALTIFYPLAGHVYNDSYIDCNDEGILFVEAEADFQLSDVLREKSPHKNNYFVPRLLDGGAIAFAQVTVFNCGGIAISFSVWHKLGGALSTVMFLSSWTSITRGNTNKDTMSIPPFGSASLFPPIEVPKCVSNTEVAKEKLVTKVFVFDTLSIFVIKEKYSRKSIRKVSRVEALVGFICSRFMEATRNKNQYRVVQYVNLRTRLDPPLPMLSFGNYAIPELVSEGRVDTEGHGWFEAAYSTRNVNSNYIKKIQNKDEQLKILNKKHKVSNERDLVSFVFSSVQNFPVYDIDYEWGKPVWVLLFPMKDGLGIDAWICLKEEDMAKLEVDNQLLQHISSQTLKLNSHSRL